MVGEGYGFGVGSTGLPFTLGKPEGANKPFYPIKVTPEQYFNLQFRCKSITFGTSQIFINDTDGQSVSVPFNRQVYLPDDERQLIYFPGICNGFAFDNSDDNSVSHLETGQFNLGWFGGIPISGDGGTVPDYGVYPATWVTDLSYDGGGKGSLEASGIVNGYFDGTHYWPFVFVIFSAAPRAGADFGPTEFMTCPNFEAFPNSTYAFEDAGIMLELFGWGKIPLYRAGTQDAMADLSTETGEILVKCSTYFPYADENDANPIYDARSGRKIGASSLDISEAPLVIS